MYMLSKKNIILKNSWKKMTIAESLRLAIREEMKRDKKVFCIGEDIGIKKSSAQITDLYTKDDLINKQIVAVVNFPPKQIGSFMSECLITGFHNSDNNVVLAVPDQSISDGVLLA